MKTGSSGHACNRVVPGTAWRAACVPGRATGGGHA